MCMAVCTKKSLTCKIFMFNILKILHVYKSILLWLEVNFLVEPFLQYTPYIYIVGAQVAAVGSVSASH